MMKNTDMKHYAARRKPLDINALFSAVVILALIVITWTDWRDRQQIIQTASHAIDVRDQYIHQLENVIDQIHMMQQTQHQNGNTLI